MTRASCGNGDRTSRVATLKWRWRSVPLSILSALSPGRSVAAGTDLGNTRAIDDRVARQSDFNALRRPIDPADRVWRNQDRPAANPVAGVDLQVLDAPRIGSDEEIVDVPLLAVACPNVVAGDFAAAPQVCVSFVLTANRENGNEWLRWRRRTSVASPAIARTSADHANPARIAGAAAAHSPAGAQDEVGTKDEYSSDQSPPPLSPGWCSAAMTWM